MNAAITCLVIKPILNCIFKFRHTSPRRRTSDIFTPFVDTSGDRTRNSCTHDTGCPAQLRSRFCHLSLAGGCNPVNTSYSSMTIKCGEPKLCFSRPRESSDSALFLHSSVYRLGVLFGSSVLKEYC